MPLESTIFKVQGLEEDSKSSSECVGPVLLALQTCLFLRKQMGMDG